MARRRPTEPTVNPARGIALVVVAVLLGLVLLRNGIDTSETITSSKDDKTATTEPDDTTDTTDATTDTTVAVRAPAEVSVVVLNGTSVNGAAGKYSTALGSAGYQMLEPGDAPTKIPATQVYFTEGFEQEAIAVAAAIQAPGTVTPALLPTPPPGEVEGANVVVVIGADVANLTPTTIAANTESTATTAG